MSPIPPIPTLELPSVQESTASVKWESEIRMKEPDMELDIQPNMESIYIYENQNHN